MFVFENLTLTAFPAVAASAAADAAATRDGDAALAGFAVPVAAADVPASAVGAVNAAKPGVAAECPNAGRCDAAACTRTTRISAAVASAYAAAAH